MKATLVDVTRLTDTCLHHAFTDLCRWRNRYYCAYRVAPSHNIVPRGHIALQWGIEPSWRVWLQGPTLTHPSGDMRDPKFIATEDVLYLMCGIYLPNPAYQHLCQGVMPQSSDNVIQTHLTYTTDGETWAPLTPILRPQYWGWSSAWAGGEVGGWVASYHTGIAGDSSSIALWAGRHLRALRHAGMIYDGALTEREGQRYRYPASLPSEPVLWIDESGVMGCAIRTGDALEIGYGKSPYGTQDWRWHTTRERMHPSAILQTKHGWLLAGREIVTREKPRLDQPKYETYTALWHLDGRELRHLLRLPSGGDTAYCGLARGAEEGTALVSYYASHETPEGLPGAAVYVATVEVGV